MRAVVIAEEESARSGKAAGTVQPAVGKGALAPLECLERRSIRLLHRGAELALCRVGHVDV